MPISDDQAFLVARSTAYDRDGTQVGPVSGIYYDDHTGRPEWVTVMVAEPEALSRTAPSQVAGRGPSARGSATQESATQTTTETRTSPARSTSARSTSVRFVPLASASYARGRLHVNVTLEQVRQAPPADADDHLSSAAENRLYRHYGLSPAGDTDVDPDTGGTPRTQDEPGQHTLLPPAER